MVEAINALILASALLFRNSKHSIYIVKTAPYCGFGIGLDPSHPSMVTNASYINFIKGDENEKLDH